MRVLYVSLIIVIVDQVSKLAVKGISISVLGLDWQGMPYGASRQVFGDFFRLTYIENPGMAFGLEPGGKLFFSLFSLVASIAIAAYLFHVRRERLGFRVALAMVLGGAVGNLIDRMFYGVIFGDAPLFFGKVVDFLDFDFINISIGNFHMTRWAVFNAADACVTVGVVLLMLFHPSTHTTHKVSAEESGQGTDARG